MPSHITAIILFSTSCSSDSSTDDNKLTIGILPDVDSVPFLIAQQKNFFTDEGITVDIKQFKSASERDSAFQTGNLDAVVSDMLAAEFLQAGSFDVETLMSTDGNYCIILGNGQNGDEIIGKDVALSKNTIMEYVTDKILESKGINPNVPLDFVDVSDEYPSSSASKFIGIRFFFFSPSVFSNAFFRAAFDIIGHTDERTPRETVFVTLLVPSLFAISVIGVNT